MAAYADLGGLGTKQGPPVTLLWKMPILVLLLLPWLAVLVLLALPSNRDLRAWWIWVPLIGLALFGAGLEAVFEALDKEDLAPFVQAAVTASFGLATLWLSGASLARCSRALGIVLLALAYAAVGLLALAVSPVWEEIRSAIDFAPQVIWYLLLFAVLSGLVYAGGLNATGWMSRKRLSGVRVSLRLLFWLWAMWVVAWALLQGAARSGLGDILDWNALLVVPIVLALMSFVIMLPFLILSFNNAFYRERLRHLLRLPAVVVLPTAPVPAPVVEQGSR